MKIMKKLLLFSALLFLVGCKHGNKQLTYEDNTKTVTYKEEDMTEVNKFFETLEISEQEEKDIFLDIFMKSKIKASDVAKLNELAVKIKASTPPVSAKDQYRFFIDLKTDLFNALTTDQIGEALYYILEENIVNREISNITLNKADIVVFVRIAKEKVDAFQNIFDEKYTENAENPTTAYIVELAHHLAEVSKEIRFTQEQYNYIVDAVLRTKVLDKLMTAEQKVVMTKALEDSKLIYGPFSQLEYLILKDITEEDFNVINGTNSMKSYERIFIVVNRAINKLTEAERAALNTYLKATIDKLFTELEVTAEDKVKLEVITNDPLSLIGIFTEIGDMPNENQLEIIEAVSVLMPYFNKKM